MNTDVKNGRQKEKAEEEELNNWTQTPPGCYQILPHDIYRSRRPTKALNFFVVRPTDTKGTKIVDGITDHFVEHMICRNYDEYEGTDENEDDKYVLCGQETLFQSIEDDEILSHRDIKVVGLSCQAYIGENKSIGLTNKIKLPTLKEPMLDGKTMKELNENENTKDIFYFARLKAGTDLGDKYVYHFDNKLSRQGEATGHGTLTPASRWNNLTRDTNPDVEYYHLNEEDLCNLDWEYVGLFSFKAGCVPFFNLPFDDDDLVFAVEVIIETQITLDDVLHIYDIIDAIKGGDIDASVELCDILRNESYCFITHEEIQRRDNAIIFLREFHQKEQSENEKTQKIQRTAPLNVDEKIPNSEGVLTQIEEYNLETISKAIYDVLIKIRRSSDMVSMCTSVTCVVHNILLWIMSKQIKMFFMKNEVKYYVTGARVVCINPKIRSQEHVYNQLQLDGGTFCFIDLSSEQYGVPSWKYVAFGEGDKRIVKGKRIFTAAEDNLFFPCVKCTYKDCLEFDILKRLQLFSQRISSGLFTAIGKVSGKEIEVIVKTIYFSMLKLDKSLVGHVPPIKEFC